MANTGAVKKSRGIWLVGGTLDSIIGSKLPSKGQVLGRFFKLHKDENKTIHISATETAREVFSFWNRSRIPTRLECHVINKIKELHSAWQGLKKNASRTTETQKGKEKAFVDTLGDLFDIAHADALTLITIQEDRDFLLAQREKGRRGTMGQVDTTLALQEARRRERDLQIDRRKRKEVERTLVETENAQLSENKSTSEEEVEGDAEVKFSTPYCKRARTSNIVTPELASAFDRTKVSNRNATFVLAATALSLGFSPRELALNKDSVRRARIKHREAIAREIRDSFNPETVLTVHWDGKMLPDITSGESVDRLAVLVSGEGVMKLLGVPKLQNGTGGAMANAVFEILTEWNLTELVQLMSFDTTVSNTGLKGGACILLEQKLNKELLSLACRHHILELIVAKVFDLLMEPSSGPNIRLFQRFSDSWNSLDKEKYDSGMKEESIASELEPLKVDLLRFISYQLSVFHPRDDYKELLHLSLLFLGAEPPTATDFRIHAPGAYHRARWMAKLIYCLKIYLFRAQFRLSHRELSGLRSFNVFVIRFYLKVWYTCQCPASAPRNDLRLLKKLLEYKSITKSIAKVAIKSFSAHLWYLSEILVGLAFFDPEVPNDMKAAMVQALEKGSSADPPKRIKLAENLVPGNELSDFVTENTKKFFFLLNIPQDFLTTNPSTWETNEDFIAAKRKVLNLKVVNDAAERGVALIQSFNAVLTNQEEQKQFLLQVVEKHRKDFPNATKSAILKGIEKE